MNNRYLNIIAHTHMETLISDLNIQNSMWKSMDPWQWIVTAIKAEEVKFVFGIGDTIVNLFAEKTPGVTPINIRNERSGPFMAMAYARLSGKPGICTGTPGPGVALMVPGVLEAYYGCSPLVMPCQCAPQATFGKGELQECDQIGMMKSITKWSAHVPQVERIPWFMHRAFSIALNGQPGPVFLELPHDVAGAGGLSEAYGVKPVDIELPEYVPAKRIRTAGDPELINDAIDLLLKAERPVVVAGNGAVLSRAFEEFREFVELLGIPFLTTPMGRGIMSEDHPLALGTVGIYRSKVGKKVYSEADVLVTVGSRNESLQTHGWHDFPEGAKFIQIDISPFEIGRNWMPDVAIVGDAKLVLRQLVSGIHEKIEKRKFEEMPRVKEIIEAKKKFEAEVESECMTEAIPIPAKRIVRELNKVFGKEAILINENGSQDIWSYIFPYYKVQSQLGSSTTVSEQTCFGTGVAGVIGAKLAAPDKNVVCVTGDGAFQQCMNELPTAAQYNVGCTWVIMNNSSLAWVKYYQKKFVGWDTTTFKVQPDFAKFAELNKCYGEKVERPSEIKSALESALKANKEGTPAVLDFIIEPSDMTHFERAI